MSRIYRIPSTVSLERLDGETIVIDFQTGRFYSFRESAADILWLITNGVEVEQYPIMLGQSFNNVNSIEDIQVEIRLFLETLVNLNLIVESDGSVPNNEIDLGSIQLPNDYARGDWVNPILTSHDELADLLAIDPIHDTTEDGWPEKPQSE